MLSETSENEVEILLSKDIKKRDFKNIVKLNTEHTTYAKINNKCPQIYVN